MIRSIHDMSIRWKLLAVALVVIVIAQLISGAVMAVYEARTVRTEKLSEVSAAASILAASVSAPLAFNDTASTRQYLNALGANPEIEIAAIYDANGALFSSYTKQKVSETSVPPRAIAPGRFFEGGTLNVAIPVSEGGDRLGTVYLRAATQPIASLLLNYAVILLLAGLGALATAVPIAIWLNAAIADPVRDIADAAARITTGDLSYEPKPVRRADEIGMLTDAFRQMVASLRQMTDELERRVAQRTLQLEAANKELEAFSYSVSHDLRAPLRAIDGFARLLEEDYAAQLDEEGKRLLGVVRSNSRKMGTLIDDLLAFSRVGRQALSHSPIDMTALAREVWSELHADRPESRAVITLPDLPAAEGDRPLIKQVWINLLSNAMKYSSQRDRPAIEVSGETRGSEIVYRVSDNGTGFDMQYYNKLFGVFQRLHSSAQFPGTGVGLAIVQRIVLRHGGRVWAESAVGEGARFYFSLPAAAAR